MNEYEYDREADEIDYTQEQEAQIQLNQQEENMEEQTTNDNWLKDEAEQINQHADYEELPSLKLSPNVITELDIDFSKPFEKWSGEQNGKSITKKIVPVSVNGVKMYWWLNVKNPVYSDLIKAGAEGQTHFKVLQTGTQANTKYVLVK